MANIVIEGHGTFTLNLEKTQELVQWLQTNGAVNVESTAEKSFEGKTLLNEEGNPEGSHVKDWHAPDRDANVGNPPPKPGTDYDFGGTWL